MHILSRAMTLVKLVEYLESVVQAHNFARPLIVGVSGPQGSGKSYLTANVVGELAKRHPTRRIVEFSMDDLYLGYEDQLAVTKAAAADNNFLLQGRGLPGTHELVLAKEILHDLHARIPTRIPTYDKSKYQGHGDRGGWKDVDRADVVVFEGWFNGFEPVARELVRLRYLTLDPGSSAALRHPMHQIEDINERLREYATLWRYFDDFIFLKTGSIQNVYKWRIQQEHDTIARHGSGMADDAVRRFVDRYMPVYDIYYQWVAQVAPAGHNLILSIDAQRLLVDTEVI